MGRAKKATEELGVAVNEGRARASSESIGVQRGSQRQRKPSRKVREILNGDVVGQPGIPVWTHATDAFSAETNKQRKRQKLRPCEQLPPLHHPALPCHSRDEVKGGQSKAFSRTPISSPPHSTSTQLKITSSNSEVQAPKEDISFHSPSTPEAVALSEDSESGCCKQELSGKALNKRGDMDLLELELRRANKEEVEDKGHLRTAILPMLGVSPLDALCAVAALDAGEQAVDVRAWLSGRGNTVAMESEKQKDMDWEIPYGGRWTGQVKKETPRGEPVIGRACYAQQNPGPLSVAAMAVGCPDRNGAASDRGCPEGLIGVMAGAHVSTGDAKGEGSNRAHKALFAVEMEASLRKEASGARAQQEMGGKSVAGDTEDKRGFLDLGSDGGRETGAGSAAADWEGVKEGEVETQEVGTEGELHRYGCGRVGPMRRLLSRRCSGLSSLVDGLAADPVVAERNLAKEEIRNRAGVKRRLGVVGETEHAVVVAGKDNAQRLSRREGDDGCRVVKRRGIRDEKQAQEGELRVEERVTGVEGVAGSEGAKVVACEEEMEGENVGQKRVDEEGIGPAMGTRGRHGKVWENCWWLSDKERRQM